VARDGDPAGLTFNSKIEVIEQLGSEILLDVRVGEGTMVAAVDPTTRAKVHETVRLTVNPERLHFFAAPYDPSTRRTGGGGLAEEGERIDLVELDIDAALAAIGTEIVDGKTIMLLQWAALSGPFAG